MSSALFIAGTDTGVGKTLVTAGLGLYLQERGRSCVAMKPIESGCEWGASTSDAVFLQQVLKSEAPLSDLNLYSLRAPLAPGVAAELEGVSLDLLRVRERFECLRTRHDWTLVEGAGGLMVPLGPRQTMVDLIELLKIPVLLVARLGLGTLNHTLLSLDYLQRRGIPVVGVVLNTTVSHTQTQSDLSERYNEATLRQWTSIPVLGVMGHIIQTTNAEEILMRVNCDLAPALDVYFQSLF